VSPTVSENAKDAWKNGNGEWPKMSAEDRVQAMLNLIQQLKKVTKTYNLCKIISSGNIID